jgi:catechol 2,3-dioxygenase-like lactoylglutathione lyase family enzyme
MTTALEFNHAMIYTTNLAAALKFYRDALGFQVVDEYPGAYARMKSPGGSTTIALHLVEKGMQLDTKKEGVRLYFEVEDLDALCRALSKCRRTCHGVGNTPISVTRTGTKSACIGPAKRGSRRP